MKSYLIPLGMRCNAAIITNRIVNQARFPFDWVQMNVESMRDVIHLKTEEIETFWSSYFSKIDETKHNTETGSWLPHDAFSTPDEIKDTLQKYVRRTNRFQAVLNSPHHVIYVIVFGFPEQENIEKILELTFAIRTRQHGPCSFLICNGMIQEVKKDDIQFLYEKLDGEKGYEDWEDLANRLEKKIRDILIFNQFDVVPFDIQKIDRIGYGSKFNDLYIEGDYFIKRIRNEYGKKKLYYETNAYCAFQKYAPMFPLAQCYKISADSLYLHYYKDYSPLWKVYKIMNEEERTTVVNKIESELGKLHNANKYQTTKEQYLQLLLEETVIKVRQRYTEIKEILEIHPFTHVNGIKCLSFDEALDRIEKASKQFVEMRQDYVLSYIHGDPQFNNILWHDKLKDIIFIDPRGYFGSSELFGIEEYDKAKVMFALSGYDIFDSTTTFSLDLQDKCISIPNFVLDKNFTKYDTTLHFLLVSIWLANSHCFVENPTKAIISYAYARLLATELL